MPTLTPNFPRIRTQADKINIADVDATPLSSFLNHDCTKRSYMMSDSIDTKHTQSTKNTTPSVSVKRSISWGTDVKEPPIGPSRIGLRYVRRKESERTPDATDEEDGGQDDGCEGEEGYYECEEQEKETQTERSGEGGGAKAGSINTQRSQPKSITDASKPATSGLPSEAGRGPSRWGNK